MRTFSLKLKVPLIFAGISVLVFFLAIILLGANSGQRIKSNQDLLLSRFIADNRFELLQGEIPRMLHKVDVWLANEPYLDKVALVDTNWQTLATPSGKKNLHLSASQVSKLKPLLQDKSEIVRFSERGHVFIVCPVQIEALSLGYLIATSPRFTGWSFIAMAIHEIDPSFVFVFWGTCLLLILTSFFVTQRIIRPISEIIEYINRYTHANPLTIRPITLKNIDSRKKIRKYRNIACSYYTGDNLNCWEQYFNVNAMAKRNPMTVPCFECDVFVSKERDEIEKLKIFLNHLLSSIQFHYQRSKHYSATLEETVSERTKELQKRSLELQQETIKSRLIIDNIVEGMLVTDPAGTIIQMNNNARKLLHISKSAASDGGMIMDALGFEELQSAFESILHDINITPENIIREVQFSSKEKDYFLAIKAAFVQDKKPSFNLIIYLIEDITSLKQLDQFRNDFFNTISHDLKNPLASILGFLDLVLHGPQNDSLGERHRKLLNYALHSSEDLQRMITDLSDLVRLESNKIVLKKFLFPISDFFYELEIFFIPSFGDKNMSITSTVEPKTLLITADFYRLKQAFMNLISNALKLGDGIHVKLRASADENNVVFIVEDNGPGIPADKIPFIFEKYSRLHNYKNDADGLGLGLSIVKSMVSLHNGTIAVESGIEKGTRFIITLPKT